MKIPFTILRKVVVAGIVATDAAVLGVATVKVYTTLFKKLGRLMVRRAIRQRNKTLLLK